MRRNDEVDLDELAAVDGVLVSPGPGTPERAGASIAAIRACAARRLPLLGVCLGHQAIGAAYGGVIERAPELLHGKTSQVHHNGAGVLAGLPSPFTATRYHSLTIRPDTVPAELEVTGRTESGVIMSLRHRELPDPRRAVPPRVGAHRRRPPDAGQLDGRGGPPRRPRRCRRRSPRRWPSWPPAPDPTPIPPDPTSP